MRSTFEVAVGFLLGNNANHFDHGRALVRVERLAAGLLEEFTEEGLVVGDGRRLLHAEGLEDGFVPAKGEHKHEPAISRCIPSEWQDLHT